MLASWWIVLGVAQAEEIDCRAFGRQRIPVAESWFDSPNLDPWAGLTIGGDTATWTRLARMLELGRLPPRGSVRPEELVQALPSDEPPPDDAQELAVRVEVAQSPFEAGAAVVRVSLTARRGSFLDREPAHLVLVVDEAVQDPQTLSVAREALRAVVGGLRHDDQVAIVTSSGSQVVLPPTPATDTGRILAALDTVHAVSEGDLAGSLHAAWTLLEEAPAHELRRVMVVSDGELDLLLVSGALSDTAARRSGEGIGLVGLGFGERHARDDSVEAIVAAAGGSMLHLAYPLDGRALADHLHAVLEPAATDVRALIEWNPDLVTGVHRVGHHLDRFSGLGPAGASVGGELGVGQTATMLYEVRLSDGVRGGELGTVRVHDRPSFGGVREREVAIPTFTRSFAEASAGFRVAVAAAALGELLAGTQSVERVSPERVVALARDAVRPEYEQDRELVEMAERAAQLIRARRECLAAKR